MNRTCGIVVSIVAAAAALTGFVEPSGGERVAAGVPWTAESNQAFANFGWAVAGAGDVNGDGYTDVIVGAPLFEDGQSDEGSVFVYYGGPAGLSTAPDWTAESGLFLALFGSSVSSAGDVDGDGYDDIIIGISQYRDGQVNEGRAVVYHGGPEGLSLTADWAVESNQDSALFGCAVAGAGDVNNDGYDDVIVGACLFDDGEVDEGRAYVFLGSESGLSTTPVWVTRGGVRSALFGVSVAGAGDVNHDGYDDVIVGAEGFSDGESDEGGVFAYLGGASGLETTPAWSVQSNQPGAMMGCAVAGAGDIDNDGHDDVIVGAYAHDGGEVNEGSALVYLGGSGGLAASPAWAVEGDQAFANFGRSVAAAGDVNNDGFADVVVGAYLSDGDVPDEGQAAVYLGGSEGLSADPSWTIGGGQALAWFGRAVSGAGDVNGDGRSDVVIGAPHFENGQAAEGRVFVYLGGTDIVPVALTGYHAAWVEGRVEVAWTLFEPPAGLTFQISRRVDERPFERIHDADVVRDGARFVFTDPSARPGRRYTYRVAILEGGEVATAFEASIETSPSALTLHQNEPNPFNPSTRIDFVLDREAHVVLAIFDAAGSRVNGLVDGRMPAGTHSVFWSGLDSAGTPVASGVYFYRLETGRRSLTRKATLLR